MDRLIFLALALLISGCEPFSDNEDTGYSFHDDFYYESGVGGGKFKLVPCLNEYFVRFKTEHQTEVINELLNRGFQLTTTPIVANYSYADSFAVPEDVKNGSVVSVKGSGNIADIPHVIYSHHLYYNTYGVIWGGSNMLHVYYDLKNADAQVNLILQYARITRLETPFNLQTGLSRSEGFHRRYQIPAIP